VAGGDHLRTRMIMRGLKVIIRGTKMLKVIMVCARAPWPS
jgi:hypothetical protein